MDNKHIGSLFDDFLKEEGLYTEAETLATNTKKASMAGIERMKEAGELHYDPDLPKTGEDLGADFWENAQIKAPKAPIKPKS